MRVDPFDRSRSLGTWPYSLWSVEAAVAAARDLAPRWAAVAATARVRALRAVTDAIDLYGGPLADRVHAEVGKPLWEARAEVQATLRQLDVLLSQGPALLAEVESPRVAGRAARRPLGVVAVLTPFPYPVFVPVVQAVAALMAGNAVVLKPSSAAPACGQLVAEALGRARLPRGVVAVVQGTRDPIGAALVDHPGVDRVLVSGRPETAEALCARGGPRVLARTSARSTAAVLADAPVERAAFEVALGAFLTAGQRCNSTARVCVSEAVADRFLGALSAAAASLRPAAAAPAGDRDGFFVGPLAREADVDRVEAWLGAVRAAGSRERVVGGRVAGARAAGNHVAPAVYEAGPGGVPGAAGTVLDVLGPVLEAVVYPGDAEAVAGAASDRSLAASVFTADRDRFEEARRALPQGSVNWNRATVVASGRLPAAGPAAWAAPGEGHLDLVRALTRVQAVLEGSATVPAAEEYPPGMGWRASGSAPEEAVVPALTGAGAANTTERAARVVARGQRARASFSDP